MAGEINEARKRFALAHDRAITRIVAEFDKATADVPKLENERVAVAKLPAAIIEQSRAEVRQIHKEMTAETNGDPTPGPLPDTAKVSPVPAVSPVPPISQPPSETSASASPQGQAELSEPQKSWQQPDSGQG